MQFLSSLYHLIEKHFRVAQPEKPPPSEKQKKISTSAEQALNSPTKTPPHSSSSIPPNAVQSSEAFDHITEKFAQLYKGIRAASGQKPPPPE